MDIFAYAMKMEKDGEKFYRELAGKTREKGIKNILLMLADDEVKHYGIMQKMKSQIPQVQETRILSQAKNIFTEMKAQAEFKLNISDIELYKKAQEIEKKSEDFYLEKAGQVETPAQKEVLLKIAKEENRHYTVLEHVIDFVTEPHTALENAEFYRSLEKHR